MSLSVDGIIEKRRWQMQAVGEIQEQLNEAQTRVNNLQQSLILNQGALLQLNALLEESGVNLEELDAQEQQGGQEPLEMEDVQTIDTTDGDSEEGDESL